MLPAECGQAWEYKTCGVMVIERPPFYGLDSQESPQVSHYEYQRASHIFVRGREINHCEIQQHVWKQRPSPGPGKWLVYYLNLGENIVFFSIFCLSIFVFSIFVSAEMEKTLPY